MSIRHHPLPRGEVMTPVAPLGPIRYMGVWVWQRASSSGHGGHVLECDYYLDVIGNDYNSIEHVLRCAIAKELGL